MLAPLSSSKPRTQTGRNRFLSVRPDHKTCVVVPGRGGTIGSASGESQNLASQQISCLHRPSMQNNSTEGVICLMKVLPTSPKLKNDEDITCICGDGSGQKYVSYVKTISLRITSASPSLAVFPDVSSAILLSPISKALDFQWLLFMRLTSLPRFRSRSYSLSGHIHRQTSSFPS